MFNAVNAKSNSPQVTSIEERPALGGGGDRPEILRTPFSPKSAYTRPQRSESGSGLIECLVGVSFVALVALAVNVANRPPPSAADIASASAALQPTTGNTTTGVVNFFQQRDGKVRVEGTVHGLTPNARHGFHIHEKGTCNSADGKNDGTGTGGHFKLPGQDHAHAGAASHHAGDLPELVADGSGRAKIKALVDGITIEAGEKSIDGRGLIVHKNPDDGVTQPTGNAGARIACGSIQKGPTDLLQHQGTGQDRGGFFGSWFGAGR